MNYILRVGLDKLKPHPINEEIYSFNQNHHKELKKSISLLGLLEPIVITQNNKVLSGHRRLEAVKELGWEDVECRLVDGVESELAFLVECNRTRIKTTKELLKEAEILKEEYSKLIKKGRPKNGESNGGKNWSILNVSEKLNIGATNLKKLMSIKKYDEELLDKIDLGLLSIGKAYSIVREKYILNEKGAGRKPNDFRTEYRDLLNRWKPTLDELVEEINISKSLSIVGASRKNGERDENDFYITPSPLVSSLLEKEKFDGNIWECACGNGDISKELIKNRYEVLSTDIIDRGYGNGGIDFLDDKVVSEIGIQDNLITNPPYKDGLQFVLQAKKYTRNKIALLCKTTFLEGVERYNMFQDTEFPLKSFYQFSKRPTLKKRGLEEEDLRGMISYGWFVWERGYEGKPTISWIK
mgnify:FL=1